MKIKIDSSGFLWVERAGELKQQFCPYYSHNTNVNFSFLSPQPCGDWCPLFSEPDDGADGTIDIWLCGSGEWGCRKEEFVDERKK